MDRFVRLSISVCLLHGLRVVYSRDKVEGRVCSKLANAGGSAPNIVTSGGQDSVPI